MLANKLLKRISDLEFEIKKLEKNEQYKYINGQAYFRQDYVLGREKKVDEFKKRIDKAIEYIENNSLYQQDYDYDYEENLVEYPPSDEQAKKDLLDILKGEDKE